MKKIKRSIKRTHTPKMGREYPNGIFYRRACEYMGIDPDNNPNYRKELTNAKYQTGI